MATSTLPNSPPEEKNNPGQDEYEQLTRRFGNPDGKDNQPAANPTDPRGNDVAAGDASDPRSEPSSEDLATAEENPDQPARYEEQVGRGYQKTKSSRGFFRTQLGKRNRIFLIGGPTIVILILALSLLFIAPFKILQIVNNLQSRFYATGENAVQNETDVLFSNYIRKYVMPALKNCPGSTTRACNPINNGGMVSQLYKGWRNAKLEDKLAQNYGLEFKYSGGVLGSHRFYLKTPLTTGNGIDLGSDTDPNGFFKSNESLGDFINKSSDPQFKAIGRNELRRTYITSLSDETKWKQVMYRYKVGRLLESKYGLKRCVIACQARDNFADWKDSKARAAKIIIAQRVIAPRSDMISLVLQCIFDGGCDAQQTDKDGRTVTAFDAKVQQKLQDYAALYGEESVAQLVANAKDISDKGFSKYTTDKVMGILIGRFGGDEATQQAASDVADKALPVVGWVNTAAKIAGVASNANTEVKHYSYVVNAASMVALYGTYRTYADEAKTGHVDLTIFGSFTDSLGPSSKDATGGAAGAEQTPLYASLIDKTKPVTSSSYTCANKKPLPSGKSICPEESLDAGNSTLASISGFVKSSGIATIADAWNSTLGKLLNFTAGKISKIADSVLSALPGYSTVQNAIAKAASPLIQSITQYLIPTPFSDNMGGGRTFDMMAGGADVSGNDFAHNGLGAKELNTQQAAAIVTEQNQQALQDYNSEPLISRVFDTNSQYSPVSKLALAMPTNFQDARSSVANIFIHPGKLFGSIGSIFSKPVLAATAETDPFGVTQYGYPDNDPTLAAANQDPENYWTQNCSSDGTNIDWSKPVNDSWQKSTQTNTNTGMPENTTTDPCLLIQASVGSSGAIFNSNTLTSEDLSGQ